MLVHARVEAFSTANANAQAIVWFYRTNTWSWGGQSYSPKDIPALNDGRQFRIDASASILGDLMDSEETLWAGFLETNRQHSFIMRAFAAALSLEQGTLISSRAFADPIIEFDQEAFDQMMGEDTYSLNDAFIIEYSPGFEPFVPEPGTVCLVATGLFGLLVRRPSKTTVTPSPVAGSR